MRWKPGYALPFIILFGLVCARVWAEPDAHAGFECSSCHASRKPACVKCHFDAGSIAPKPQHIGLTKRHLKRIACETCHITGKEAAFYQRIAGRIYPSDVNGAILHHHVQEKERALGTAGCKECHSSGSRIFSRSETIGIPRSSAQMGAWRERYVKPSFLLLLAVVVLVSVVHYCIFGPNRKMQYVSGEAMVQRFGLTERIFHGLGTVSFAGLVASAFVMVSGNENPASHIRWIHGILGLGFAATICYMAIVWYRNCRFVACDSQWLCNIGGYFGNRVECPAGKFNAGQKIFYWLVICLAGGICAVSGIMLLVAHGMAASWVFLAHDVSASIFCACVVGHMYLASFANPNALSAMISGKIMKRWADKHHLQWIVDCSMEDKDGGTHA